MKTIKNVVLAIVAMMVLAVGVLPASALADGNQTGKKPMTVTIAPITGAEVNKAFTIEVTLTDSAGSPISGKKIILTINGAALSGVPSTDSQGKTTVTYTPCDNTTLVIKAVYQPSSDTDEYAYSESETRTNVAMSQSALTLQTNKSKYYYGEQATISGKLVDGQGVAITNASLSLFVNNEAVDPNPALTTNGNGEYTYTMDVPDRGKYTLSAAYGGVGNAIKGTSASAQFSVDYLITISVDDITIGDDAIIHGTTKDSNGNPLADSTAITINIGNDEPRTATISGGNGEFALTYTPTSTGSFAISATFDIYKSNSTQFTVEPFQAKIYVKSGTYPKAVYDGEPIVLSIDRNGSRDDTYASYQWYKDGAALSEADGGKNRDLPITYCDECGTYTCKVKYCGKYEVTTDPITVEFAKRSITVKPDDVEKEYDSTPLTSTACSAISATKLASSDAMQATVEGSRTVPGSSSNKIKSLTITRNGQLVYTSDTTDSYYPHNNYEVTLEDGSLTVNRRSLGTGEKHARGVTMTQPPDVLYDAQAHNPEITITIDLLGNGTITTLQEGTDYELKRSGNVNAGTSVVEVTGKGYYTGSAINTFKIRKRKLAASSPSLEKDYDKTPLTGSGGLTVLSGLITDEDASLGLDGLVSLAGHRVTGVRWTGSQLNAGSSKNTFELLVLDQNDNDVSANYELDTTNSHMGTLTVHPIPDVITVTKKLVGYSLEEMFDPGQDVKREGNGALTYKYYMKAEDGSGYTQLTDVPTQPGTYYLKIFEAAQGNYIDSESDYIPFTITERPSAPSTISYSNTKGNGSTWTKGSTNTLSFTFKRSEDDASTFSHFTGIRVDGKPVTEYEAKSGSVVVTLKPAFLETLSVGKHTLTAEFDDGKSASASFTILAAKSSKKGSTASTTKTATPRTKDETNVALCLVLTIPSLLSLGAASYLRRGRC